jgi:hypothetical protein
MARYGARLRVVLAIVFGLLGIWLIIPGRNVIGNPWVESEIAVCSLPGDAGTIRLYKGGGGATVASWCSVTYEAGGWFSHEHQIYCTTDVISGIKSEGDSIVLSGTFSHTSKPTFALSLYRIKAELVERPLIDYRGIDVEGIQPMRLIQIVFGVLFLLPITVRTGLHLWKQGKRT